VGVCVFATAVARETGFGIADAHAAGVGQLVAALDGACGTVALIYAFSVPTSLSAAVFSSMVGALWAGPGLGAVRWSGVETVAISLVGSIVIGAAGGAFAYRMVELLLMHVHRIDGERIVALQYVTMAALAAGYGANDLERTAGLLAAAASSGSAAVPAWTSLVAALAFVVGLAVGGGRVARTVGGKLFSIRPPSALAAQASSAGTVIGAALLGGPLSTTAVAASALIGVGAALDPRAMRWYAVGRIVATWAITVPAALAAGALAAVLVRSF